MTEDQREGLLGLAFGLSAIVSGFVFFLGALMADGVGQAFAYSGFAFVVCFVVARFILIRIGNTY